MFANILERYSFLIWKIWSQRGVDNIKRGGEAYMYHLNAKNLV